MESGVELCASGGTLCVCFSKLNFLNLVGVGDRLGHLLKIALVGAKQFFITSRELMGHTHPEYMVV